MISTSILCHLEMYTDASFHSSLKYMKYKYRNICERTRLDGGGISSWYKLGTHQHCCHTAPRTSNKGLHSSGLSIDFSQYINTTSLPVDNTSGTVLKVLQRLIPSF